jgi:hypothetical protein
MDMLEGQYQNPVSVIGFNVSEAWSQDVSADVALEIRQRCDLQARDVPFYLEDFVDRYEGRYHDVLAARATHPQLNDCDCLKLRAEAP